MALARSARSLSKTGSPQPAGTFTATILAAPPIESCCFRTFLISCSISAAAAGSGQRTALASTCSSVTAVGSGSSARMSPIWSTMPSTRMPWT